MYKYISINNKYDSRRVPKYKENKIMAKQKLIQKIEHSPTLNTVLMVENTLKNAGEVMKVSELKRLLPKKVMHQTLLKILNYLYMSGKILISTKGVVWIYTPKEDISKLIAAGLEL